jgi:hypothetical protein
MPSTFRNAAAAVVLVSLFGLSALPADAQPKRGQATDQVETKILGELWHWLADRWAAPSGALQQMYKAFTQLSTSDAGLNRGGVYDPNGHS